VKPVEFDPDARTELDRAASDYEAAHRGLGVRFYAAVERAVRAAALAPKAGPPFPGVPERLGVRRRSVARFPFVLAYRDLGHVVRIDAAVHTRRRPGYWLDRIT
jgi:toxin ParE1/3/4